jgi:hypothetical protein
MTTQDEQSGGNAPAGKTDGKGSADRTEFATHLLTLDKGRVHDDATDRLAELIAAVARTGGKKGKITLTITAEAADPETFADTGVITLDGEVKVDKPQLKRAPTIFYIDGPEQRGQITRQDPNADDRY